MAKTYDQHLQESLAYLSLPALAPHSAWSPNTDVYETPENLVVTMEIAGISRDDRFSQRAFAPPDACE